MQYYKYYHIILLGTINTTYKTVVTEKKSIGKNKKE